MIPENFKTLVDKLIEKTTKKEAIWSKTSRDDEFKLDLGKGAITVDMWQNEETGEYMTDIAVINERGDRVDSIAFSADQKDEYNFLSKLHTLAKRDYYKVDETFKTIFKELDSDKTIGKDKKTDDFPF